MRSLAVPCFLLLDMGRFVARMPRRLAGARAPRQVARRIVIWQSENTEFLVEISTTECTETPLATQKADREKAYSKYPAAISLPVWYYIGMKVV